VKVVWKVLIDILSGWRRNKRCHDEIDVGEKEENDHWKCSAKGRYPVLWISVYGEWVVIEVDESSGDKDVNHIERVGDDTGEVSQIKFTGGLILLEDEVVCVSRWRSEHDCYRY
jgi:hypothetical protein